MREFGYTQSCHGCLAAQAGHASQGHSEAYSARMEGPLEKDTTSCARLMERPLKVQQKAGELKADEDKWPEAAEATAPERYSEQFQRNCSIGVYYGDRVGPSIVSTAVGVRREEGIVRSPDSG